MDVTVQDIARHAAKVSDPREVIYAVRITIDGQDRLFEVRVTLEQIGPELVPCATFRDPNAMRIFRQDQRAITDILRGVLDVYNREKTLLPA